MMAGFDLHSFCACCRDKKKGKGPCVEKPNVECQLCKALTPEQVSQLATPSYKLKKEKRDKAESTPSKKSAKPKPTSTAAAVSTDQKFQELDQKWSDRFNWLEALLLAKTLDRPQQEPTFSTVKVVPTHSPPANVIRSEPFINPADQPVTQTSDLPATSSDLPAVGVATDPPASSKKTD